LEAFQEQLCAVGSGIAGLPKQVLLVQELVMGNRICWHSCRCVVEPDACAGAGDDNAGYCQVFVACWWSSGASTH